MTRGGRELGDFGSGPLVVVGEVDGDELLGINDDVANAFAVPGVNDVHETISGLNDGWIRVFAFGLFESQHGFP